MDLMFDSSNSVAASYFVTIVAIAIGISLSYTPLHDFIHVTANLVRCLIGGDFVRGHARAIYNFYNAQLCHLSYLRFLGVANDSIFKGLEIGPFIMQESYEEAGKIPVCQYVTPCRNQLHMPLAAGALMQMWTSFHRNGYSAEGTLFLDIGCGNGMAILSAMTLPFDAIVGLDINEGSLDICRANVHNFAKTDKARTEFVYIEEMNMIDIDLSPYIVSPAPPSVCNRNNGDDGGEDEGMVPRQEPTTRVCCLLYEPLWTMPKHEAHAIYLRTVQSLKRQCRNQGLLLSIFYFSSPEWMGDAYKAIESQGGDDIDEGTYTHIVYQEDADEWYLYEFPELEQYAHRRGQPNGATTAIPDPSNMKVRLNGGAELLGRKVMSTKGHAEKSDVSDATIDSEPGSYIRQHTLHTKGLHRAREAPPRRVQPDNNEAS